MKEEITRINRLVAEGRLSPEDAADLIDAFYTSDRNTAEPTEPAAASGNGQAPPPPPPPHPPVDLNDSIKGFIEGIEKLARDGKDAVNWQEVAGQARDGARKGLDALKVGLEEISKGKVNLGWLINQESREVTLPLSVGPSRLLKIENPCGLVRIVGGFDVGSVTARARVRAASPEEAKIKAREYTLIVEETEHLVLIRQPDVSGLCVDLEVQLAGSGSVEVRAESGEVQVMDTHGGARITSRSGSVKLRGLSGGVEVVADSGSVSIEDVTGPSIVVENKSGSFHGRNLQGNLNVRAASGSIDVSGGSGRIISLETVSGSVQLSLEEPVSGSVNVRTVSGSSSVAIPEGSDCRVSLSTLRGQVSASVPLSDEAKTDTRLTGKLGDGTGTVDISAVTGSVSLELRGATVSA